MKPSVISGATAADSNGRSTATNNTPGSSNGINIPINHQYGGPQQQSTFANDPNIPPGYNSPSNGRQFPHHFQQNFGFDPDIDSMFQDTGIRSRLGRMQDPFGTFGSRKRCGNEPQASKYFDDDPDFFPHFGTLGNRRRAAGGNTGGSATGGGVGGVGIPTMDPAADGDDFFDRLPPEFRQYIPEGFGMAHRRSGSAGPQSPRTQQQPEQQQQQYAPQYYPSYGGQPGTASASAAAAASQSPKILRDAAIQTECSQQADAVDGHQRQNPNHLNQHGLRNTFDMADKLAAEEKNHGVRAQSAPPNEQPTVSPRSSHQNTPPPQYNNSNFSTQTSPQVVGSGDLPPNYQKSYYPTQNQSHQTSQQQPTQQQQPSTPGGSNIRTIPIFVEGRSEPIINSHKEIPNQSQAASNSTASTAKTAHNNGGGGGGGGGGHQQQHRPTPLNTQQASQENQHQEPGNHPPQTPHTMDSINKIQDIQRDVLDLMSKVEKFAGKRQDKEYAYLDEMLTRNLLKLDTIDTNGKESIRMARKEAIKCIQASINVLEAKAEENAKAAAAAAAGLELGADATGGTNLNSKSSSFNEVTATNELSPPVETAKSQEAIPLPPPNAHQKEPSPAKDGGQKYVQKETTVVDAKTE